MILLLGSCQKNINDVPAKANNSSAQSDLQVKKNDASVATDWYKLQLRFLLEKNSSLPNGVYFGYIGIGLYESVRNGTPGAISLSEKLYQMPAMPAKEMGKSYNWQVSANAAMAEMVRHFYIGITKRWTGWPHTKSGQDCKSRSIRKYGNYCIRTKFSYSHDFWT